MMVMEKVVFSAEVPLSHLNVANELRKALKHENVQFGVIVRVREAWSGKERSREATRKAFLDKIHQPFD